MQLNQSRLLDLFAQNFVVQRLQIFLSKVSTIQERHRKAGALRALHSSFCAKNLLRSRFPDDCMDTANFKVVGEWGRS
jgi:hypothetical protein